MLYYAIYKIIIVSAHYYFVEIAQKSYFNYEQNNENAGVENAFLCA